MGQAETRAFCSEAAAAARSSHGAASSRSKISSASTMPAGSPCSSSVTASQKGIPTSRKRWRGCLQARMIATVEAGAEPSCLRVEVRRPRAGRDRLDRGQQLLDLLRLPQGKGRLECLDDRRASRSGRSGPESVPSRWPPRRRPTPPATGLLPGGDRLARRGRRFGPAHPWTPPACRTSRRSDVRRRAHRVGRGSRRPSAAGSASHRRLGAARP